MSEQNPQQDPPQQEKPQDQTDSDTGLTPEEMQELFGDLQEETPETIKAERDELLQKLADITDRFGKLQRTNLDLARQLAAQKEEATSAHTRMERQAREQQAFALEKFVKEILPVLDTLELGINTATAADRAADPKLNKMVEGFEKALSGQLSAVFNKFGIRVIDPKGEVFDHEKHEAIGVQEDPAAESDTVVAVAQKGYELNGRIIRAAKVVVNP